MASLFSAILFLALSSSFSHQIVAESARKELRSKLLNQVDPVLSNRINPSRVVQVSWQPRVFIYKGFITDEECNHLISMAHNDKATGIMNSSYVKDDIVSMIEKRVSAWSFLPHENSRPMQVQRYTSEVGTAKYDYIGNKSTLEANAMLIATVILYLSNASKGGELVFPNTTVSPTKGNAVLFFNVHPNASPDKSSAHERRPVVDGEMWCAVKLIYMRPVVVQDDGECIDLDDDCARWAANGECERNPVYMVGSNDYYGTCRNSCKVC